MNYFINTPSRKLLLIFLSFILSLFLFTSCQAYPRTPGFDSSLAYSFVEEQLALGGRHPGSEGHQKTVELLQTKLKYAGWSVEIWDSDHKATVINNIVATREDHPDKPWIVLGAHYDTRLYADNDPVPSNHTQPVPGANDGASGVAVLLALAHALPENLPVNVWLVFFDAEDQGRINDWDWIVGSTAFVDHLTELPDEAIIIDMIGDSNLSIYFESTSNHAISKRIWDIAEHSGYGNIFIPEQKYAILDDHTPFLNADIPAVDIIDFDYPYWHTVSDTVDKVSPESLDAVGSVLFDYLTTYE